MVVFLERVQMCVCVEAVLAFRQYDRECVIRNSQFAMGQSMAMRATRHCFVLSALSPLSPFPTLPSLRILRLCAPSHAIIDGPPACRGKGFASAHFTFCAVSSICLTAYVFISNAAYLSPSRHFQFVRFARLFSSLRLPPFVEDYRVKY